MRQAFVTYDTATLTAHIVTTTRYHDAYDVQPDLVMDDGAVYVLDPQLVLASGVVPARLYLLRGG